MSKMVATCKLEMAPITTPQNSQKPLHTMGVEANNEQNSECVNLNSLRNLIKDKLTELIEQTLNREGPLYLA